MNHIKKYSSWVSFFVVNSVVLILETSLLLCYFQYLALVIMLRLKKMYLSASDLSDICIRSAI